MRLQDEAQTRSFITVASGSQFFFDMAMTLARSIALRTNLTLYVVSDQRFPIPGDVENVHLIVDRDLPKGFRAKIHLDKYLATKQTIFLDADCILLKDPVALFDVFRDRPVGIFGLPIKEGEWFGDVSSICQKLSIPHMFRFNGGFYYLEQSEEMKKIYDCARELCERYDEIGFVRLRGQPNEEVLIGCALAKFGITAEPNFGFYYADFQWWPNCTHLDVLSGQAQLSNYHTGHSKHQNRYPSKQANPIVLHFLGHHGEAAEYKRAAIALRLRSEGRILAAARAGISVLPLVVASLAKRVLRPAIRFVLPPRKVRTRTKRYIEPGEKSEAQQQVQSQPQGERTRP